MQSGEHLPSRDFRKGLIIPAILVSLLTVGMYSPRAAADSVPEACFFFDSGTGTITGYDTGNPSCVLDIDIPSNIGGTPVTAIGDAAFASLSVTAVQLPSTLVSIGDNAFANNLLTTITIPNSVTQLLPSAFYNNRIETLTIGSGISVIQDSAFYSNRLTSITIPATVTYIQTNAFGYNSLTTVRILGTPVIDDVTVWDANGIDITTSPEVVGTGPWAAWHQTNAQFIRFYTADGTYTDQAAQVGYVGTYITMALIVNPGRYTVEYKDENGQTIAPSRTVINHDQAVTTYRYEPFIDDSDPLNPTVDGSSFYRIGESVTVSPQVISGYATPDSQTITLGEDTIVTFVYAANSSPEVLAETGSSMQNALLAACTFILTGVAALSFRRS
jgi:hypothetical protein